MARFLLAVWPYTGHVYPNLALAHSLRARGHEVAFYTGAMARPTVRSAGFTCFPFREVARHIAHVLGQPPGNRRESVDTSCLYEELTQRYTVAFDQGPLARTRRLKAMYREWLLGTVPAQVKDLSALLATWKPDVLVCDPFMWGPILILHETQPTPTAVFSYFAGSLLPGTDAPPFALGLPSPRTWRRRVVVRLIAAVRDVLVTDIRREANHLRRSYGLPPLPTSVMAFAGRLPLYLITSVPELDYHRHDLPPSAHYVGPCLWDKPDNEPPPAWLNQLPQDRPLVYVTEGTANVRAPMLLRAAIRGLANLPPQVIVTTGRHRDPAALDLGPVPANVRVERWVPHSDLLPKVSLVVAHGGSGTVLSALNAGLPLVIVPMQWDHLENAQRVVEAGVGVRLSPRRCTPERVRAAAMRVLNEPAFRQNAQRLATVFARYGGPKRAAYLLECLSTHRLTSESWRPVNAR